MGVIAKILSFTRTVKSGENAADVKADPGGGDNLTGEHFSSPGDDSHPLENDTVFLVDTVGDGNKNAVGYMDTKNIPKSDVGEKRIYARDGSGAMVAEIWLKKTGSIVIDNGSGSVELEPSGDINLNGVIIDANGKITAPEIVAKTSLKVGLNESELLAHVHGGVTVGTAPTGPLI